MELHTLLLDNSKAFFPILAIFAKVLGAGGAKKHALSKVVKESAKEVAKDKAKEEIQNKDDKKKDKST